MNPLNLFSELLNILASFALAYKLLNAGILVEIFVDQTLREPFVEDQHVVILVEPFVVDGHEGEELRVDNLRRLRDTDSLREDLLQVGIHSLRLLVEGKEDLGVHPEQILLFSRILRKDLLLEHALRQSRDHEVLDEGVWMSLNT